MRPFYSEREVAFRAEIADFLRHNLPSDIADKVRTNLPLTREEQVRWEKIIGAKGWLAPHWPAEYGGPGWSAQEAFVYELEAASACAPKPNGCNISLIGPTIIQFGSQEQKDYYLPRILSSEDWWCQGFSEPDAGSDLAALRTTAKRQGDEYVINGQKIWTTLAQHSNLMFCLARTSVEDRKQLGISMLIIPMDSEGVDVRPIITLDGTHEVNEVFLKNVRIPVGNLIGEEGRGWNYAKFLLSNERVSTAEIGRSLQQLARIKQLASSIQTGGDTLLDDPDFSARLAWAEIELLALEMTARRMLGAQDENLDVVAPMLKLVGSELQQELSALFLEAAGPLSLPDHYSVDSAQLNDADVKWKTAAAPHYFNWRKASIYSGSNEIQREILSRLVIGTQ